MPHASASSVKPGAARNARRAAKPFFGALESVLVEGPVDFDFSGAIVRSDAAAAWTWMVRDLAPDLIDPQADETSPDTLTALDALLPELLSRARDVTDEANKNPSAERRLMTQFGGEAAYKRLPTVLNALKCRALLEKAQNFGRATNAMTDERAVGPALQSMPFSDKSVAALLMQATIGQVANPSRLTTAVVRIAGSESETVVVRAGFAPLVDAIFAHAQNQVPLLNQVGPFADIDLTCRAVDRFHRLLRSINGYIELNRNGRWAMVAAALTKTVSERVEPKLKGVVLDVNKALRRYREGGDRLDSDQLLQALNGVYVLATVRDARDSLALNAIFDQIWTQVGQTLEIHIQRNLDQLRADPTDRIVSERLDAAIKMAELRFNTKYAEVLRRAKEAAAPKR